MIWPRLLLTGIAALIITACNNVEDSVDGTADVGQIAAEGVLPPGATILDASELPVLLDQCSRMVPEPGTGAFRPLPADVIRFEAALPAAIHGQVPAFASTHGRFPAGWVRQYVGIERGTQRTIYGNFAPTADDAADASAFGTIVCDGGPGFFGAEFDIESGRIIHLAFNGEA